MAIDVEASAPDCDEAADRPGDETLSQPSSTDTESNPRQNAKKKLSDAAVNQHLTSLAGNAGQTLVPLDAAKRTQPQLAACDKTVDEDWNFAMLVYNKLKEIPEGDDKDDLQLDILHQLNHTKQNAGNRAAQQLSAAYQQEFYPFRHLVRGELYPPVGSRQHTMRPGAVPVHGNSYQTSETRSQLPELYNSSIGCQLPMMSPPTSFPVADLSLKSELRSPHSDEDS